MMKGEYAKVEGIGRIREEGKDEDIGGRGRWGKENTRRRRPLEEGRRPWTDRRKVKKHSHN